MNTYLVTYALSEEGNEPQQFQCQADDAEHAEEQCLDAYPGAHISKVTQQQHAKPVWTICSTCDGHGHHSRDFGAITQDEWNGPDWDDESRADYIAGAYDKPCVPCNGTGKVDTNKPKPERDSAWESEYWLRMHESGVMG